MRINSFKVEERALGVETNHLAARSETRVNAHYTLLSERSGEEELTQVLGEHAYSLLVGGLLARHRELGLYRRLQQTLEGVVGSLAYQLAALAVATHVLRLYLLLACLVVGRDAHLEEAFALAATHGKKAMGRAAAERLREVEVVAVFLRFLGISLRLYSL